MNDYSLPLQKRVKYLKYAVPMGELVGVAGKVALGQINLGVDILDQLNKDLPALKKMDALERLERHPHLGEQQQLVGAALRALHHFLNDVDPHQEWGSLKETSTPDGNILWLCPKHRETYIAKPLNLELLPDN